MFFFFFLNKLFSKIKELKKKFFHFFVKICALFKPFLVSFTFLYNLQDTLLDGLDDLFDTFGIELGGIGFVTQNVANQRTKNLFNDEKNGVGVDQVILGERVEQKTRRNLQIFDQKNDRIRFIRKSEKNRGRVQRREGGANRANERERKALNRKKISFHLMKETDLNLFFCVINRKIKIFVCYFLFFFSFHFVLGDCK